jgi:hypothetical protein
MKKNKNNYGAWHISLEGQIRKNAKEDNFSVFYFIRSRIEEIFSFSSVIILLKDVDFISGKAFINLLWLKFIFDKLLL